MHVPFFRFSSFSLIKMLTKFRSHFNDNVNLDQASTWMLQRKKEIFGPRISMMCRKKTKKNILYTMYQSIFSFPALLNSLLLWRELLLCVDTPKNFQDITKGVAELKRVHGKIALTYVFTINGLIF